MMKKLNVTRIMYKRQELSSHTENARVVVMNIYHAEECKSCQHKTINCCSANICTAITPKEDVTGSTTNDRTNVHLKTSGFQYSPLIIGRK
jgi:hypothetical protein